MELEKNMPTGTPENQILPFYYSSNLPSKTVLDYRHIQSDGYDVLVLSSLFSKQVKDLEGHLKFALDALTSTFETEKGEILDRMKASIFGSGDKLADFLISKKEPVDDVDYNVCICAFKNGIVYVWIDGNIGVRMYRGEQSLMVNSKGTPQFFGSATVELGDILAIAFAKDLEKQDEHVEDYVLEKSTPDYAGLFIDYQVENSHLNIEPTEVVDNTEKVEEAEEMPEMAPMGSTFMNQQMDEEHHAEDMQMNEEDKSLQLAEMANKRRAGNFDETSNNKVNFNDSVNNIKDSFNKFSQKVQDSGVLSKIVEYIKLGLGYIWLGLMTVTSLILDGIFGLVYLKNPHQFKRFQNSIKKKNLQYLLIVVILLLVSYLVFFRGPSTNSNNTANNGNNTNASGNSNASTKAALQSKFDQLHTAYVALNVENFNSTYTSLKSDIAAARDNNFDDPGFLNNLTSQAQSFNDDLYKITPITKIDEAFSAADIAKANIVDFSLVGTDVYAADRANSQILKSDSSTQKLTVFASDTSLTAITHISCLQTSCYIIDENVGIVILNLQTKTFSKFSALKDAGKGVKELQVYLIGNTAYLYTLVPSEGKIARYSRSGDGLTPATTWNKVDGFGIGTVDFTIDGGIFEMNANGNLRKFFGGTVDSNVAGLSPSLLPLGTDLQIASTPARNTAPGVINRFYIADSANQRVVVYEKDPNASKQYTFKGSYQYRGSETISFSAFKQIILSEDEKTLYGLSNNIVFRFSVSAI